MLPTRIEIIPSTGIVEQVQVMVPLTTTLTITCLPHHGIEQTMRAAVQLTALGYTAVPHLAARSIQDRAELARIMRDCELAGIDEVFVIGGDGKNASGPYGSSLQLLEEIAQYSGGTIRAGVAGYPEGHPSVNGLDLFDALLAKQHLASHIVTQMCFSAPKILDYARLLRREGVELPLWAGVAGAVSRTRLVSLAARIGVGTSVKFLSRKGPLARRLLSGDRYSPQALVSGLMACPDLVSGIHLYSFNNLEAAPVQPEPSPLPATGGSRFEPDFRAVLRAAPDGDRHLRPASRPQRRPGK